jgi:hypothetical protein
MRSITLIKDSGEKVRVTLNNYGSGVDCLNRRWVLDAGSWNCLETAETAHKLPILHRLFGTTSHQPTAHFA